MDLLEYQAKKLFHQVGIPILPSQPIADPSELKRLHIPYPVVLKSQVRAGGRGRAGGIHFVENTIDAIAAARSIFNLSIMGEYPQVLLAEARYNAEEELFLAVLLDYQLQRPVLLGSTKGGMDVENLLKNMQKVIVDAEFSPFYTRRLAIKMGLTGKLIQAVSNIAEKMYYLFQEKDLDIIEINPLGVGADGELMALDGKISVNESAIARHPDLVSLLQTKKEKSEEIQAINSPKATSNLQWIKGTDSKGNIGIICNSLSLTLATWDLIAQERGKLIGGLVVADYPLNISIQEIEMALNQMLEMPKLKVILLNCLIPAENREIMTEAIIDYLQRKMKLNARLKSEERIIRATGISSVNRERPVKADSASSSINESPSLVIRLLSDNLDSLPDSLADLPIYWTTNLEQAISQTLTLAKA